MIATSKETETLPRPSYVFRVHHLPNWRFEARPISVLPVSDKDTVALMYRRTGDNLRQSGVGIYRNGEWRSDKRKKLEGDLFWTIIVDERDG